MLPTTKTQACGTELTSKQTRRSAEVFRNGSMQQWTSTAARLFSRFSPPFGCRQSGSKSCSSKWQCAIRSSVSRGMSSRTCGVSSRAWALTRTRSRLLRWSRASSWRGSATQRWALLDGQRMTGSGMGSFQRELANRNPRPTTWLWPTRACAVQGPSTGTTFGSITTASLWGRMTVTARGSQTRAPGARIGPPRASRTTTCATTRPCQEAGGRTATVPAAVTKTCQQQSSGTSSLRLAAMESSPQQRVYVQEGGNKGRVPFLATATALLGDSLSCSSSGVGVRGLGAEEAAPPWTALGEVRGLLRTRWAWRTSRTGAARR
mmetsp:Transcript_28448/g.67725  ORF Transcript_28448/g.67725 Transcript_28448/m.67725 type:complete len:320 (-) Transcript_28448:475-1434(-)